MQHLTRALALLLIAGSAQAADLADVARRTESDFAAIHRLLLEAQSDRDCYRAVIDAVVLGTEATARLRDAGTSCERAQLERLLLTPGE